MAATTTPMAMMSQAELVNLTQQLVEMTEKLQVKLEASEQSMQQLQHLAQNSDAFFIILNAIIIFCKYILSHILILRFSCKICIQLICFSNIPIASCVITYQTSWLLCVDEV